MFLKLKSICFSRSNLFELISKTILGIYIYEICTGDATLRYYVPSDTKHFKTFHFKMKHGKRVNTLPTKVNKFLISYHKLAKL